MVKSTKSIEEKIEEIAKKQLDDNHVRHFAKTESVNPEIDGALAKAASKSGGKGGNYPDIKVLIVLPGMRRIPVMIEVKGKLGDFVNFDKDRNVENFNDKGEPLYQNIKRFAVNGAVHYAQAIIDYSKSYKETIAIGFNGYEIAGEIKTEIGVYYLSRDNMLLAKKIADYSDLSFLTEEHLPALEEAINDLSLTEEEKERRNTEYEIRIETILQKLNQRMEDSNESGGLNIKAESRVQLVCGMIMAALGFKDVVAPLEIEELKGQLGKNTNDGAVVLNRINDFLNSKKLPQEKKDTINSIFSSILQDTNYYTPRNGESPIKSVFTTIKDDIMPLFLSAKHLDFTGRLFNVLTSWIPLRPGDDKNDVVLTPRYVTEMMARLCKVDMNSYVWDYTAGSGGFLVSAMKLMIEDARRNIKSERELATKIEHIHLFQVLGLELRPEIYILAVLNMILMGDGSSHILNKDSLTYEGKYEQSVEDEGDKPFPADVFLLNPPYSKEGKGFVFVEKALAKMSSGRAAILIQENAGGGNGLPFTKRLLERNTLLASIKMPGKLFVGKASVQTGIYVFEVGKKHDPNALVKFIDFSYDGYKRQYRKKASLATNLRDDGTARERYQELVDVVLDRKPATHHLDGCVIRDTISLKGNDWTCGQHQSHDAIPTEEDFRKSVSDYMAWQISTLLTETSQSEDEDFL